MTFLTDAKNFIPSIWNLIANNILKHFVKSVRIRSYSGPHFPAVALNTEISKRISSYSVLMRENTEQSNSEYGHFSHTANVDFHNCLYFAKWSLNMTYPLDMRVSRTSIRYSDDAWMPCECLRRVQVMSCA